MLRLVEHSTRFANGSSNSTDMGRSMGTLANRASVRTRRWTRGVTDYSKRATFTGAQISQYLQTARSWSRERNAPELRCTISPWEKGFFGGRNVPQLESAPQARVVDELGQGVGQSAGTDVVDRDDRVVRAECPARVDDFLAPALTSALPLCTEAKSSAVAAGS